MSSRQHGCLPYVITMVSALSVGDPFLREEALVEDEEQQESEEPEELVHLTSQVVKEKELRKLRRRAFFDAQEVWQLLFDNLFKFLSICSYTLLWESLE